MSTINKCTYKSSYQRPPLQSSITVLPDNLSMAIVSTITIAYIRKTRLPFNKQKSPIMNTPISALYLC